MANILIFEDETDLAELYRLELEDRGHRVLGIYDDPGDVIQPKPGPRLLMSPDLIVLDERLGTVSGTKFLSRLRKAYPGVRIIVVSADPDAIEWSQGHGADAVARKPVLLKRLAENIESVLAKPLA